MALVAGVIFTLATFVVKKGLYLKAENINTNEVYLSLPVNVGDEFSVEFIHSVNKSPVIDVYRIESDGIYADRTVYYDFGAGVQTELYGEQTLTYGNDNSMIIGNINRKIVPLSYYVGTVSDHTLHINEKNISLRELCGKNSHIVFVLE